MKHYKQYFLATIQLVVLGLGGLSYGQQIPFLEHSMPLLDRQEFAVCLIELDLKGSETEAVLWILYDEYIQQLNTTTQRYRKMLKKCMEQEKAYLAANPRVHDPWVEEGKDFGRFEVEQTVKAEFKRTQEHFRDDLKTALGVEQVDKWFEIERTLKRKRLLSQMSSRYPIPWLINLVEIMEVLALDKDHLLLREESLLDDYLSSLDIALDQWNAERAELLRVFWANGVNMRERINNDRNVRAKRRRFQRAAQRQQELIKSVVSTNKDFSQLVAAELEPDNRLRFIQAIQKENYPFLFTPSPVEVAIDYLSASDLLVADRRNQANSIAKEFAAQPAMLRRRIIEILESPPPSQLELERLTAARSKAIAEGRNPWEVLGPHPIAGSLLLRREMSIEALRRLRSLFSKDEFTSAPVHIRLLLSWNK